MTTLVDAPTRVDGVQLIGEMVGSGYRTPPALVRRADGQVLQLTQLLYLVLNAADGRRTCAEIAALVSAQLGRTMTEGDVGTLVDRHLRPLGLVMRIDGSAPELKRSDPLLGLKLRVAVTDPHRTRRLTDPFRVLFRPLVVAAVVLGFVAVVVWVFFERGLGASAYDAFDRPHLLLLVFVVSVLSGGFHEFGHAAATRYGGAEPGAMGAGLYLVWPAFYTDVTDSYRLDRIGRIRTDLGGLYFNAIVVVLTFAWWWVSGWEALLLLVATQVLQMVQQLLPLLRFDGYHLLADLAGIPDLYQRIRPTLLGLLPHRWRSSENRALKPGARALVTAWVLVTIPLMALMLWAVVRATPRLVGTAVSVVQQDAAVIADAWGSGRVGDVVDHGFQTLGVVLSVLACGLILGRIALRFLRGLGRWSEGSLVRRVAATALSAVLLTSLSAAWWPDAGTYRPIEPGERGLLTSLLPVQPTTITEPGDRMGAAARTRLAHGGPLVAAFEKGKPLPTKDDPALAVVLVPTGTSGSGDPVTPGTGSDDLGPDANETWVFPFDKPLPPAEGDTQALAVATQDGSVVYDLAFALVWADGDEVLNVNEAHAYASCSNCVAVAVALQVVLIVDDAQVVVPQNLAVAATYDCYQCITAAIASQLVLTVQAEPREEDLRALAGVWNRLLALAQEITSIPLAEVSARLEAFKTEIVDILADAPPLTPPTSTSPTTTPSPITTPSPTTTGSPTEQPTDSSPAATPAPEPPPPSAPPSPTDSTPSTPGAPPPEETAPAPSEPAPDTGTSGETGSPTPAPTDAPSPTGSP